MPAIKLPARYKSRRMFVEIDMIQSNLGIQYVKSIVPLGRTHATEITVAHCDCRGAPRVQRRSNGEGGLGPGAGAACYLGARTVEPDPFLTVRPGVGVGVICVFGSLRVTFGGSLAGNVCSNSRSNSSDRAWSRSLEGLLGISNAPCIAGKSITLRM